MDIDIAEIEKRRRDWLIAPAGPSIDAKYASDAAQDIRALLDLVKQQREALEETRDMLKMVEQPKLEDEVHGAEIRALGERVGFGVMMVSAQALWRRALYLRGDPVGGEFIAGPCFSTAQALLAKVRAVLALTHKDTGK